MARKPKRQGSYYGAFIDTLEAQGMTLCPGCLNYAPHANSLDPGMCPGKSFHFGGQGEKLNAPYTVNLDGVLEEATV